MKTANPVNGLCKDKQGIKDIMILNILINYIPERIEILPICDGMNFALVRKDRD